MKFDSTLLIQILITFLLGCVTSYVAAQRGRNRTLWFVCGLIFGWLALLFAIFLPVKEPEETLPSTNLAPPIEKKEEIQPQPVPQKGWYYIDSSRKQSGPVPAATLQELWSQKLLSEKSYVWQEGMAAWAHIRDLPELIKQINP